MMQPDRDFVGIPVLEAVNQNFWGQRRERIEKKDGWLEKLWDEVEGSEAVLEVERLSSPRRVEVIWRYHTLVLSILLRSKCRRG